MHVYRSWQAGPSLGSLKCHGLKTHPDPPRVLGCAANPDSPFWTNQYHRTSDLFIEYVRVVFSSSRVHGYTLLPRWTLSRSSISQALIRTSKQSLLRSSKPPPNGASWFSKDMAYHQEMSITCLLKYASARPSLKVTADFSPV